MKRLTEARPGRLGRPPSGADRSVRPPTWLLPSGESQSAVLCALAGWESRERLSATRSGETDMAKAVQNIKLSPSRDIPFNKLVLSQKNVRRIKAGISIDDLAEDIARRPLLQSRSE